jgi:hypothetical protein
VGAPVSYVRAVCLISADTVVYRNSACVTLYKQKQKKTGNNKERRNIAGFFDELIIFPESIKG